MVQIRVDSRIRILDELPQEVEKVLCSRFVYENPEYNKTRQMGYGTDGEPPTYRTWRKEDGILSFPRGRMHVVRDVLKAYGLTWSIEDIRTLGGYMGREIPEHRVELYPYQEDAVQKAIAKQNCLIRAPTGSGKTTAALALVARLKLPTLVMVWSGNLMDQWIQRLEKELGLTRNEIGIIQGPRTELQPITVGMQQSIVSRLEGGDTEMLKYFGVVICDEVQRFAAPTLFASIDPFPAKYRIGVSADETRKDQKEFLTYDLFGQVAADIPRQTLIDSGHVLDVEIYVVPTGFYYGRYKYNRNFNELLNKMRSDAPRNAIALEIAEREIADGQQVLIFSHRVEHCLELDRSLVMKGHRSGILLGGPEYKEVFRETRAGLEVGKYRAAVGTIQAIGQGLDIPKLSRAIVTTPIASNQQMFNQVRGRVCRTGKTDAKLYYLWDEKIYGRKALTNLISWNNVVRVWDGMEWVEGSEYLRLAKQRRA